MAKIILTFKGDDKWHQTEAEFGDAWVVYEILEKLLCLLSKKK
jgi:hypothetical protein